MHHNSLVHTIEMTSSEKFCLKWNDFQLNIGSSFADLRKNPDFSDVTLVCEENHQIEAHRVILSACSPLINSMLKENKHSHPMIYMRGLKAKDLEAIIDFIYQGEANIYQEDLETFLALAEELQLKGLAPSGDELQKQKVVANQKPKVNKSRGNNFPPMEQVPYTNTEEFESLMDNSLMENKSLVATDIAKVILPVDGNKEGIDSQIETMMERINGGEYNWKFTVCGKMTKGSQTQMKRHVEVHLEGLSYPCTQCGKVSRSSNCLNRHMTVYHRK